MMIFLTTFINYIGYTYLNTRIQVQVYYRVKNFNMYHITFNNKVRGSFLMPCENSNLKLILDDYLFLLMQFQFSIVNKKVILSSKIIILQHHIAHVFVCFNEPNSCIHRENNLFDQKIFQPNVSQNASEKFLTKPFLNFLIRHLILLIQQSCEILKV